MTRAELPLLGRSWRAWENTGFFGTALPLEPTNDQFISRDISQRQPRPLLLLLPLGRGCRYPSTPPPAGCPPSPPRPPDRDSARAPCDALGSKAFLCRSLSETMFPRLSRRITINPENLAQPLGGIRALSPVPQIPGCVFLIPCQTLPLKRRQPGKMMLKNEISIQEKTLPVLLLLSLLFKSFFSLFPLHELNFRRPSETWQFESAQAALWN